MKKLILLLLLALPLVATAQEGTVTYLETRKMNIQLPPEMEHMRAQIPDAQTSTRTLAFNSTASLMKNAPKADDEKDQGVSIQSAGGDFDFQMKVEQPENETYVHFDDHQLVEKRDFLGRTFLITGEPLGLTWKLTDERSTFLGYSTQKAEAMRDTMHVEAWFTTDIPVPAGPDLYGGLPGLILVLSVDDGQVSYVAQDLSLEPLAKDAIAPPKKGKKVTREEYDQIVAEKMKEMGAEPGGHGVMKVIVREDQ